MEIRKLLYQAKPKSRNSTFSEIGKIEDPELDLIAGDNQLTCQFPILVIKK